jgi:pyrroline-5-carboxylate reductase
MATTPPVVPPKKQSWLSKVGSFFGKILGLAQKAEPSAVAVAEALLPQFAPEIALANDIFNKIIKYALVAETTMAAAGDASGTGPQKLAYVLGEVGPLLDAWVASNFPGQRQVSAVAKSGLINAVVAILNELEPPPAAPAA